jgi:hypothetical protein
MRIHASSNGRRAAGLVVLSLLMGGGSKAVAQTWAVSTTAQVHDVSAENCGLCPEQSKTASQTKSYTLPADAPIPLFVSVQPQLNTEDNGFSMCGNMNGKWCQDSSWGVGASDMGHKRWNGHHNLWAKAYENNNGTAELASHAEGVLKIVWPLHADGTVIPNNSLQLHFHANGKLIAQCAAPFGLSASADMQAHITTTPFSRPAGVGGLPPAIGNMDMVRTVVCLPARNEDDGPFDVVVPLPNGIVVGDRYSFTIDWTNETDASSIITDTPLAEAYAQFQNTGALSSDSSGDQTLAVDFDTPDPILLPACPLNVGYFRGSCTAGTAGAPCNSATDCGAGGACDVTATTTDDQTVLNWPVSTGIADVTRGLIPSMGAVIWTLGAGTMTLNNASCLVADALGGTSGALPQSTDPNPAVDTAIYYQVANNNPSGASATTQGCSMPSLCNNAGWCQQGATPGMPCNGNVDCGGGTCVLRPTLCSVATGGADQGGCAQHSYCSGGSNDGGLCLSAAECPGGTCVAISSSAVTPGQICYSTAGTGCEACPPAGSTTRVVRLVTVISFCP